MNCDPAVRPGQRTVLGGIGSELVHNESEGLRDPRVQHHMAPNGLDPVGEGFEFKTDDLVQGGRLRSPRI